MTEPIVLRVIGVPQPQGNKSAFVVKGKDGAARAILREGGSNAANKRHGSWRSAVADAAREHLRVHPAAPITGPLSVTIDLLLPLPASDRYRWRHTTKPDVDKLVRSIFDALVTGGLIANDSQVWRLTTTKRYAHDEATGAVIQVWDDTEAEAEHRGRLKAQAAELRRSPAPVGVHLPLAQAE